jgi:inner membrane protein
LDNLAHTLIGIGVARAGLSRKFGPGTTLTLAIASNIPDVDVLWAIWDPLDRFMLRRTHSHALVTVPVLAALLATAIRWKHREKPWSVLFGLSALGIVLHLLFDVVNSFGVVLLWPFALRRFELSSIFIIDLFIWIVTLLPLAASLFLKSEPVKERMHQAIVALLGVYIIFSLACRSRAEALARGDLERQRLHADVLRIFPEPLGPQRFRAVARVGDAWHVSLVHLGSERCEPVSRIPTFNTAPRVAEIRATPTGRRLEWFMAAPVWTLHPDGRVTVYDLRFNSVIVPREGTFVIDFPPGRLDPAGR